MKPLWLFTVTCALEIVANASSVRPSKTHAAANFSCGGILSWDRLVIGVFLDVRVEGFP
jgi:hypothetical protein